MVRPNLSRRLIFGFGDAGVVQLWPAEGGVGACADDGWLGGLCVEVRAGAGLGGLTAERALGADDAEDADDVDGADQGEAGRLG